MNRIGQVAAFALVSLLLGCGQNGPDIGAVTATGTVTYRGAPVEGAQVAFLPDGSGRAAAATTDSSGRFSLNTAGAGDGAVPGSYKVIVTKTSAPAAVAADASMTPEERDAAARAAMERGETKPPEDLLPAKYKSPATSGLTATIAQGEKNEFSFELKD